MIEAVGLRKEFDSFCAVDGVSLQVQAGELLALLGPNGAGKTTTVRMLGAILRPTSGAARINGFDIVREAADVRRCIGMLTEQPGLYPRMTGIEYLLFYGRLYGMNDAHIRKRAAELFERFAMPNVAKRRLGAYSKGMRQKVGLMRAMLHDPAVLLLDEPTSAMDPYSARLVRNAIQLLREDRRSIILCTHNLAEAEEIADRIAIIADGHILASGSPHELKSEILGPPQFELTTDRELNGQAHKLAGLADALEVNGAVIRYRTADPTTTNPRMVRALGELDIGVVSLQEAPRRLEDVYLAMLGDQAREARAEVNP